MFCNGERCDGVSVGCRFQDVFVKLDHAGGKASDKGIARSGCIDDLDIVIGGNQLVRVRGRYETTRSSKSDDDAVDSDSTAQFV